MTTESGSCDGGHVAQKDSNISYLVLYREVCQLLFERSFWVESTDLSNCPQSKNIIQSKPVLMKPVRQGECVARLTMC